MKEIKRKTIAVRKAAQREKLKAAAVKKAAKREKLKAAAVKKAAKREKLKAAAVKKADCLMRKNARLEKAAARKAPRAAKRAKEITLKNYAVMPLQLNKGERIIDFEDGDITTFVGDYVGSKY